jgi:hypothetical protein
MDNDQESQLGTETEENKSVFACGMIRVMSQSGITIGECGDGLGERNAMLPAVLTLLPVIPREAYLVHIAIIML